MPGSKKTSDLDDLPTTDDLLTRWFMLGETERERVLLQLSHNIRAAEARELKREFGIPIDRGRRAGLGAQ